MSTDEKYFMQRSNLITDLENSLENCNGQLDIIFNLYNKNDLSKMPIEKLEEFSDLMKVADSLFVGATKLIDQFLSPQESQNA